ncbi:reverse transcriptase domain-containing protein [Tanacetum coccineum]
MFRQTLGGVARNWFDDLDPKSVDSFEEVSQKFLEEFSQQKRYAKDPTEIHSIKRRQNEGFHPELSKKLNDKIPKTVDEMFERVRAFIMGEVAARSAEMIHPSQGYKIYVRPVWTGGPERARNRVEEANIRSRGLRKIGSSSKRHPPKQPAEWEPKKERRNISPLGVIDLLVTMGREGRSKTMLMEFAIVKCRSPYNIIIGRTRMRSLGAMGSTIYSMIKFPTNQGVVTMETSREALRECKHLERVQGSWKEVQWHQREEQMSRIREQVILRSKSNLGRGPTSDPMSLGKTQSEEGTKEENMEMDYSGLNKAGAKDMYPLLEEGEKLASLMGYPYKYFLQLPKQNSQIRIAEEDKEKTGFHTEEGVYCFTHMLKELKNSAATLQRMMEKGKHQDRSGHLLIRGERRKVFRLYCNKRRTKGISRKNIGNHPKPHPKKSKSNTKLIPATNTISKFILKLAELKHPLREARTRMEIAKGPGWMNEAEEAF